MGVTRGFVHQAPRGFLSLPVCLPASKPTNQPPSHPIHVCTPMMFTCISGLSNIWGSWNSHLNEVTTGVLLNQMWIRPCETYFVRLGQVQMEQNYCTESRERAVKEHVRCFREKQLFDRDEWLIWSIEGLAVHITQRELYKYQWQDIDKVCWVFRVFQVSQQPCKSCEVPLLQVRYIFHFTFLVGLLFI